MGVDKNISLGPYLVAEGKKIVSVNVSHRACDNDKCKKYRKKASNDEKFCTKCGTEIKKISFTVDEEQDARDLLDENDFLDELVYTDPMLGESNIFLANHRSPFDNDGRSQLDESGDVDISKLNIAAEIEWFKERYKKVLDVLIENFGEENVQIKWGVVVWYS